MLRIFVLLGRIVRRVSVETLCWSVGILAGLLLVRAMLLLPAVPAEPHLTARLSGMDGIAVPASAAETKLPLISADVDTELPVLLSEIRVPVIMYHQFSENRNRYTQWCMSPEALRADLQYLKDNGYTTMLPSALVDALNGEGELPDKPVLLTFDDGHATMFAWVLPLLEEFDMYANVNVVGAYCDQYTGTTDHDLDYAYLSWEEVSQLAASGRVEIGNHSNDLHSNKSRKGIRILPGESDSAYRDLLVHDTLACQEKILAATGARPVTYAYPFGFDCPQAVDILAEMGYTVLLGCQARVSRLDGHIPLELERFNRPSGMSTWKFFQKIDLACSS